MIQRQRSRGQYWWNLKDTIRVRCHNRCEWCARRPMTILHHRTYATYGAEKPCDVMGVCSACHKAIHGLLGRRTLVVNEGSLADLGDRGMGDSRLWRTYLARCTREAAVTAATA